MLQENTSLFKKMKKFFKKTLFYLFFWHNYNLLFVIHFSLEMLQKIAFARTEEILELCDKSLVSNVRIKSKSKMILMGEGSKILDNKFKDKISFSKDIDFLEETLGDVCQSGYKLRKVHNKQEVVVVPKKQIKHGFFEKLFLFFK